MCSLFSWPFASPWSRRSQLSGIGLSETILTYYVLFELLRQGSSPKSLTNTRGLFFSIRSSFWRLFQFGRLSKECSFASKSHQADRQYGTQFRQSFLALLCDYHCSLSNPVTVLPRRYSDTTLSTCKRIKVAVLGAGVAGLTAAVHFLLHFLPINARFL